jgi:hypothetical protein
MESVRLICNTHIVVACIFHCANRLGGGGIEKYEDNEATMENLHFVI